MKQSKVMNPSQLMPPHKTTCQRELPVPSSPEEGCYEEVKIITIIVVLIISVLIKLRHATNVIWPYPIPVLAN